METRRRNNCRPLHINNELWQYRWGKSFVTIYTPQNKRYNIPECEVFIAYYGKAEYKKRLADTIEWRHYSWDRFVFPSDFDLKILYSAPRTVKAYIISTFAP
jgi:hypothetical protein